MTVANRKIATASAMLCLLVLQAACMIPNLWTWSPVWDEPGHLVSGLNHWKTLDFRLYSVNPPLCRMLATIPALLADHAFVPALEASRIPAMRGEFELGKIFFERDPPAALRMLRLGRSVAMLWPLAGTVLLYVLGQRIFGSGTGWITALIWAFNPMVLAHGVLLPPDIPAAIALMVVAFATATWWRKPGIGAAVLLGLAFGFALSVKTTLLIAYPVVLLLGLGVAIARGTGLWRRVADFLVAVCVSLFVINAGYAWSGTFTPLGKYAFVSNLLNGNARESATLGNRFEDTPWGSIPVPLPKDFLVGIDVQYSDFERGGFYPYLAGKWDREGFALFYVWYYLLKMPTASLFLFIAGSALLLGIGNRWRDRIHDLPLLISLVGLALAAFLLVSTRTDHNFCQRYSLIALPGFCLVGGAVWAFCGTAWQKWLVKILLGWGIIAGIGSVPHSLSYFNEIAGGVGTGRYMLHGNATDWAQDRLRLGKWCQRHPERRPLSIATTGERSDLKQFGVVADSIRTDGGLMGLAVEETVIGQPIRRHGWHVVSMVHLLYPESPYFAFRYREAEEWIGQTHAVFYVDEQVADRWRQGTLQPLPPMRGHEHERAAKDRFDNH